MSIVDSAFYAEALVRPAQVVVTLDAAALEEGAFNLAVAGDHLRIHIGHEDIQIPLPVPVRQDRVAASCLHGVMEVTLARHLLDSQTPASAFGVARTGTC